jgi:hypothetical protein
MGGDEHDGGGRSAGATAKIVFGTGLRLRFHAEFEEGRLFIDEAHLPGARLLRSRIRFYRVATAGDREFPADDFG